MAIFNISKPTKPQVVHSIERIALVYVLAVAAYLKVTNDPCSKAAWIGAGYAGVAAVYQAVVSVGTTL